MHIRAKVLISNSFLFSFWPSITSSISNDSHVASSEPLLGVENKPHVVDRNVTSGVHVADVQIDPWSQFGRLQIISSVMRML